MKFSCHVTINIYNLLSESCSTGSECHAERICNQTTDRHLNGHSLPQHHPTACMIQRAAGKILRTEEDDHQNKSSQMAERIGNQAINQKVAGSIPARAK